MHEIAVIEKRTGREFLTVLLSRLPNSSKDKFARGIANTTSPIKKRDVKSERKRKSVVSAMCTFVSFFLSR